MKALNELLKDPEFSRLEKSFRHDVPLAPLTWFKTGGKADTIFKPASEDDLSLFLKGYHDKEDLSILGACSNVIIRDGGLKGVTIKLGKGFASIKRLPNNRIYVGGAALDYTVASFCMQEEISGMEFLSGIPGTIGGNLAMNAGCYGFSLSDIIESFDVIDMNGNKVTYLASSIDFSYRYNPIKNVIFTGCTLKGVEGKFDVISATMQSIKEQRYSSQPVNTRTSGSTFVNPVNHKAWYLIDQCGLRGFKVGGAMISEKHCNFIINYDNATSNDIESLGSMVQNKVKEKFGIDLEWEIKKIGCAIAAA